MVDVCRDGIGAGGAQNSEVLRLGKDDKAHPVLPCALPGSGLNRIHRGLPSSGGGSSTAAAVFHRPRWDKGDVTAGTAQTEPRDGHRAARAVPSPGTKGSAPRLGKERRFPRPSLSLSLPSEAAVRMWHTAATGMWHTAAVRMWHTAPGSPLRYRLRRSPPPPLALPELRGRTAIVTGGSSGIGEATALELARAGARVVVATHSAPRGEAAALRIRTESGNAAVRFMALDLASLRSVRAFASAFLREEPHLHLLINNAGVSAGGTTEDGFSLTFQVNHLSHFLLTELLLRRLRCCAPSRVVIVASSAHRAARLRLAALGSPSPGPLGTFQDYCDSKLANVLHARELATRLRGTGVTCYAAHPGLVDTGLFRHSPLWLKPLLVPVARLFFRDAAEGARTPLYCAVQSGIEAFSGCYFSDCAPTEPCEPGGDERMARELREGCERLLGL